MVPFSPQKAPFARLLNYSAISFGSELPRPHEIVLWIGYATGPRVNARCKGQDQKEVDALVASFASGK
jgi:hypothetical protein